MEVSDRRGIPYVVVEIAPRRRTAACPGCGRCARSVHSRYDRTLTDISVQGHSIILRAIVRRFACRNKRCHCRIFCERLTDLAQAGARRTQWLKHHLETVGLALGGRPGERFCVRQGQLVSRQGLVRSVRASPESGVYTPRFLGVDDWAIRKGRRYGTILVDLESHRPVDMLPDRTAESLADWLKCHRGVELISRDRAAVYAEGGRMGAPTALQIADRWHLAKNLGDALERLLNRHRAALQQAVDGVINSRTATDNGDARNVLPVPASAVLLLPPSAALKTKQMEEGKQLHRAWRYGRYEQAKSYCKAGMSIVQIARTMHLDRQTVSKFVRADVFPERKQRVPRGSVLDNFQSEIEERWDGGCHNAALLLSELRDRGYTGGYTILKDYLHGFRGKGAAAPRNGVPSDGEGEPDRCSPRRVAAIALRKPEDRRLWERKLLEEVEQRCEPLRVFRPLADWFLRLLRAPKDKACASGFTAWIEVARCCTVPEVRRFAKGLEQDRTAVEAAMALPWSNGPVEGAVARLKAIKRQMYGRANFDLLRKRVLMPG